MKYKTTLCLKWARFKGQEGSAMSDGWNFKIHLIRIRSIKEWHMFGTPTRDGYLGYRYVSILFLFFELHIEIEKKTK